MTCLEYRLQRENYWMKTLRTVGPYKSMKELNL